MSVNEKVKTDVIDNSTDGEIKKEESGLIACLHLIQRFRESDNYKEESSRVVEEDFN